MSPESVELDFLGATATLSATVTDQHGGAYNSGTVTWTSSSPSVFGVDARGVVTAVSNGSGWARAFIDGFSDSASVAVVQVSGAMNLQSGEAQEGLPGTALPAPIVVRVVDLGGSPVAGAQVSFTPSTGHGSVAPNSASTDDSGTASTMWTLGAEIGPQLLTATESGGHKVQITALGTTGSSMEVVSGARQRALPGHSLQEPVVVRVLNSRGEPFAGPTVVFTPDMATEPFSPIPQERMLTERQRPFGRLGTARARRHWPRTSVTARASNSRQPGLLDSGSVTAPRRCVGRSCQPSVYTIVPW